MFWALVSDNDIVKKEQFLSPFFELASCKPELFTSGFGGGGKVQRSQKKKRNCNSVHGGNKVWLPPPCFFSREEFLENSSLCIKLLGWYLLHYCHSSQCSRTLILVQGAEYEKKKASILLGKEEQWWRSCSKLSTQWIWVCAHVCVKGGAAIHWLPFESINKPTSRGKEE